MRGGQNPVSPVEIVKDFAEVGTPSFFLVTLSLNTRFSKPSHSANKKKKGLQVIADLALYSYYSMLYTPPPLSLLPSGQNMCGGLLFLPITPLHLSTVPSDSANSRCFLSRCSPFLYF